MNKFLLFPLHLNYNLPNFEWKKYGQLGSKDPENASRQAN